MSDNDSSDQDHSLTGKSDYFLGCKSITEDGNTLPPGVMQSVPNGMVQPGPSDMFQQQELNKKLQVRINTSTK